MTSPQDSFSAPSRRRFLQFAGGGLATTAGIPAMAEEKAAGGDWIDAHVHVWTPDTTAYPLAAGFDKTGMQPPSFTPEELFAHTKPQGVSRIVLIQMSFYGTDNRYMLDVMKAHPGVFGGVAIVDEKAADLPATLKTLAEAGVRGLRITPGKVELETWINSDGMKALWGHAADAGLAICPLINPEALPLIEFKCRTYPRTRVVIDHFARIGMAGPVQKVDLDNLCKLAHFPSVHVKTSAFYALGEKKAPYTDLGPMVERLVAEYGAERLMWASDCPFQVEGGHTYGDSIGLIRDRLEFLKPEQKEAILRGTAEKVFFS